MTDAITTTSKTTITATADIWEAFLAECDATPKTVDTYRHALRCFRRWLDAEGLEPLEVTRDAVLAYKRDLAGTKSAATVNAYLTAVRAFYRWTEAKRVYPNVAAGVKGVKVSRASAKDALTPAQAVRVLQPAGDGLEALRDYAMVNLMLRRGLRTVEVSRANVGDIRQTGGKAVLYVQGKGYADKGEIVVLSDDVLSPIHAYLAARGPVSDSDPLFAGVGNRNKGGRMTTRSVSRIAKDAMTDAGVCSPRLTAHSLRHTAVTFALMAGATVQEAQAMARHSDISTTMVYAHNLDRLKGSAETAVDALLAKAARDARAA
jgi:integrase/recombinase XerD